jgi:uncharacterized lipoprotein YddW (UPF0748 family)
MNRSQEAALFVTNIAAQVACDRAMQRKDVHTATYARRYSRGELRGYWVCLKHSDGTLSEMSEDYAAQYRESKP